MITVTRHTTITAQLKAAGFAETSRRVCFVLDSQFHSPKLPTDKIGFSRDASDSLHGRKQVTICFAVHTPLFCKCKTDPEALYVYLEEDSKGLFRKTLSCSRRRTMPVPWSAKLPNSHISGVCQAPRLPATT